MENATEKRVLPNVIDKYSAKSKENKTLLSDLNKLISGMGSIISIFVDGDIELGEYIEDELKKAGLWLEPDEAEHIEDIFYEMRKMLVLEWLDFEQLEQHFDVEDD